MTDINSELLWHECPNNPHDFGMVYDEKKDVIVCPICGYEQWEEMGG